MSEKIVDGFEAIEIKEDHRPARRGTGRGRVRRQHRLEAVEEEGAIVQMGHVVVEGGLEQPALPQLADLDVGPKHFHLPLGVEVAGGGLGQETRGGRRPRQQVARVGDPLAPVGGELLELGSEAPDAGTIGGRRRARLGAREQAVTTQLYMRIFHAPP